MISDTFGSEGPIFTGEPYLYVLCYCFADRENYIKTGKHLEKFIFKRPNLLNVAIPGKLLLIGSTWDFLEGELYGGKIIERVVYPNGTNAFLIVARN